MSCNLPCPYYEVGRFTTPKTCCRTFGILRKVAIERADRFLLSFERSLTWRMRQLSARSHLRMRNRVASQRWCVNHLFTHTRVYIIHKFDCSTTNWGIWSRGMTSHLQSFDWECENLRRSGVQFPQSPNAFWFLFLTLGTHWVNEKRTFAFS